MTERFTPLERSAIMRAIKGQNTKPEITVRKLTHALGYRFRLHGNDLPGKPDLVFGSRSKVIFINGCFWHGHSCKRGARKPKTNAAYWQRKISVNKKRDATQRRSLARQGWKILTIWECEIKNKNRIQARLTRFLGKRKTP